MANCYITRGYQKSPPLIITAISEISDPQDSKAPSAFLTALALKDREAEQMLWDAGGSHGQMLPVCHICHRFGHLFGVFLPIFADFWATVIFLVQILR